MELIKPYVVTIVGAESSGKTTLSLQLASAFRAIHMPEYAREYLSSLQRNYTYGDLCQIAEKENKQLNSAIINLLSSEGLPEDEYPGNAIFRKSSPDDLFHFISSKISSHQLVVVDGGMLTLRMWARIKYKTSIPIVEEALQKDVTDLYVLCRPGSDWQPDPLREAPDIIDRVWIYNHYLNELMKMSREFVIVDALR